MHINSEYFCSYSCIYEIYLKIDIKDDCWMYSMSDVRAEAITLIHSELEEFSERLRGYVALRDEVRWAERNMPSEIDAFTDDKKKRLVDCLKRAADFNAENVIAPGDITIKLARILARLEETAAYVEPAREPAVAGVDEEGIVVSREWSEGKFGEMHVIEIRKYADNDPRGIYQEWVDNKFNRTLPDSQEARMPAMVEMRGLLGRLDALK